MKKIIVIGCPGSGKTTFSKRLQEKIGLPLFHLDAIWHKPDRTHVSREAFDSCLDEIFKMDSWILDGNYSRTIEKRFAMCDTVFLFDLPTRQCLEGAISRLGKSRCDLPWLETELDPNLKNEILQFQNKNLNLIYDLINRYKKKKMIKVFHTRKEADEFLLGL